MKYKNYLFEQIIKYNLIFHFPIHNKNSNYLGIFWNKSYLNQLFLNHLQQHQRLDV